MDLSLCLPLYICNVILSTESLLSISFTSSLSRYGGDLAVGAMTIINIPVIIILGKYAFRAIKDFEAQRKKGLDPVFRAKDIDLPHKTDYWND